MATSYVLKISELYLRLESDQDFPIPDHLSIFQIPVAECPSEVDVYRYVLEFTEELPQPEGKQIAVRDDIQVFESNGLEMRYLSVLGDSSPYGCYKELDSQNFHIYILTSVWAQLKIDTYFCSLLALEKRAMEHAGMILHCSFHAYRKEAILFSAPSETGKTTHGNLWNRYCGSHTVNGDRALLRCVDGVWHACGWPICGSSEVCRNEAYPIRAIVMIHQAETNSAHPLDQLASFRQVYSQITMNRWNTNQQLSSMDLLDQLLSDIPVYQLNCNISEDAVRCIETEIFGIENNREA